MRGGGLEVGVLTLLLLSLGGSCRYVYRLIRAVSFILQVVK